MIYITLPIYRDGNGSIGLVLVLPSGLTGFELVPVKKPVVQFGSPEQL
jgi:hypothetical protein